ncbi:intramolecular oxidoreductase [Aureococcus anophagefferens]|nr:intramolecular oxidoreductase [Aureococcus anophagefferens]
MSSTTALPPARVREEPREPGSAGAVGLREVGADGRVDAQVSAGAEVQDDPRLALASAAATELTPETWDDAADGKIFKFLAPGGRDEKALKAFAETKLVAMCSVKNQDLCSEEKKAEIAKFMAMEVGDLNTKIEEQEAELKNIEADFKKSVEGLQKLYEGYTKEKEEKMAAPRTAASPHEVRPRPPRPRRPRTSSKRARARLAPPGFDEGWFL